MAKTDTLREARRALRHIRAAQSHFKQLPEALRREMSRQPPRQTPFIVELSPEVLWSLLEARYGVECACDRLRLVIAAMQGSTAK
ncbi:hypothetical protein [Chromobacterium haemolyticum]|uniref:hypothetical protein n=1 Tax=Chromobacterium haemolyticum TaxID=394935 RepID=UPI0009DA95E2|nr:hypothetical protein [Chromobacterium haemolyticum]OQS43957.1 hypothetical protein B0T39_03080 [Chromobacterium haemolyticum]